MIVDAVDSIADSTAITKGVLGGIGIVRAEAAAFVLSVSARIGEEHVVREGDNNEISVVRDPSRCAHAVVERIVVVLA